MKNTLTKTLITIALIAAPLATFAAAKKTEYQLPTYTVEEIETLPEPTHYPIPSVKSQFVGLNLKVKFTVNTKGRPESVRLEKPLSSYSDVEKMTFASRLENAVKAWKFEPAMDKAGNAVAVKVILPVQVIEKGGATTAMASLVLDTSKDRS